MTIERRLMSKVMQLDNGCWQWLSAVSNTGYGLVSYRGKTRLAHRVFYELITKSLPKELDHLCRNTLCVNPLHLESVTHRENVLRHYAYQTHCKKGHLFDDANTYHYRDGTRKCRECNKLFMRTYRKRNKVND